MICLHSLFDSIHWQIILLTKCESFSEGVKEDIRHGIFLGADPLFFFLRKLINLDLIGIPPHCTNWWMHPRPAADITIHHSSPPPLHASSAMPPHPYWVTSQCTPGWTLRPVDMHYLFPISPLFLISFASSLE